MDINEEDFKEALGNWYWSLDEYNNWDDKTFNDMLKKYGYTVDEVIKSSLKKCNNN